MTALTLAGTDGARNRLLEIHDNNMAPMLRRGDAVIWQEVRGFCDEGCHVIDVGRGQLAVYQIQPIGGLYRLLAPGIDMQSRHPQEVDYDTFTRICVGRVVARVKMEDRDALLGRKDLTPRPRPAFPRRARQLEHA